MRNFVVFSLFFLVATVAWIEAQSPEPSQEPNDKQEAEKEGKVDEIIEKLKQLRSKDGEELKDLDLPPKSGDVKKLIDQLQQKYPDLQETLEKLSNNVETYDQQIQALKEEVKQTIKKLQSELLEDDD
ncbi:unnamed protein product [Bursaphelenchus xylophilus]|uniref:(pine wood nematode) hypothetical protein n=1 Tax=Bursaphelenchus xylophilus TaxID=6326 RepID=A0A1I7RIB1_BURXY|nr:unnamed protein product [Bursaphelenchus xylophilus]CAG9115034.1 unnamed protein product [Bursaphelenchus xylophilus]